MARQRSPNALDDMANDDKQSFDRDTLIRLTVEIEKLVEEVAEMRKDYRSQQTINTTTAVLGEKVSRLERIVYGCMGAIGVQALGLVGILLQLFFK